MKREEEILVLLAEVLQKMDRVKEETDVRLGQLEAHVETKVDELKERFNKVEWRHDDLTLKHEELRYSISQTVRSVAALTQAVAVIVAQQSQTDARLRRLERPDDFGPQSAVA